jgi:hypothetical protein
MADKTIGMLTNGSVPPGTAKFEWENAGGSASFHSVLDEIAESDAFSTRYIAVTGGSIAASAVDVEDTGGYFTGDDVEAALQELGAGKAAKTQAINAQTGTSYTFVLADADKLVTCSNASPFTLTVPPNSSVAFPVGTRIDVAQLGAGQVTIDEDSGVTVNVPASLTLLLAEQYAEVTLTKLGTDTWILAGNLEAS